MTSSGRVPGKRAAVSVRPGLHLHEFFGGDFGSALDSGVKQRHTFLIKEGPKLALDGFVNRQQDQAESRFGC